MVSEPVRYRDLAKILVDPAYPEEPLVFEDGAFLSPSSGRRYPVRPEGFVDFVDSSATNRPSMPPAAGGILFRLNEYYNRHFEQKISRSLFAGGGILAHSMDKKIKRWLEPVEGLVIDVGCGDRKAEALLGSRSRYLGVDYLPVTQLSPWRTGFPDVNADALRLPLRNNSADCVLNVFVLEHVTRPAQLIGEICRVVRPGGMVVLAGPGDICMSHGEPHNYFNMTRFAYRMLLEENGLVIEEDYYPARFWVSILALMYSNVVRNNFYNGGTIRKLLQLPIFGLSLVISPLANLVALALDSLLPFDQRGYFAYMVRARKPG